MGYVPMRVSEDGRDIFDRERAFEILVERYGMVCQFPGCHHEFSPEYGSPWYRTLDHIYPQGRARLEGWKWTEIWDIDNLAIMHRFCNQKKGDSLYNEDGTLSLLEVTHRVKLVRPDICALCYAGRLLQRGEECPDCGLHPQPSTWPAYLQKDPRECAHDAVSHCKFCVPGFVERLEPLKL